MAVVMRPPLQFILLLLSVFRFRLERLPGTKIRFLVQDLEGDPKHLPAIGFCNQAGERKQRNNSFVDSNATQTSSLCINFKVYIVVPSLYRKLWSRGQIWPTGSFIMDRKAIHHHSSVCLPVLYSTGHNMIVHIQGCSSGASIRTVRSLKNCNFISIIRPRKKVTRLKFKSEDHKSSKV